MAAIRDRVLAVLKNETGVDPGTIDFNAPIRDQVAIDSMQFVGIIAALETELGLEVPSSIVGVTTLSEFIAEVEKAVG